MGAVKPHCWRRTDHRQPESFLKVQQLEKGTPATPKSGHLASCTGSVLSTDSLVGNEQGLSRPVDGGVNPALGV